MNHLPADAQGRRIGIRSRLHDAAASIAAWAHLLAPPDRALLNSVLVDNRPCRDIARLLAVRPRTVHKRLQRLVARVRSPKFLFIGAHLPRLPSPRRQIAEAVILHGLSLRAASRSLHLPIHNVRRHALALHTLFETAPLPRPTTTQSPTATATESPPDT